LHHRYPKPARLRRAPEFRRVVRDGLVCPGAEAVVRTLPRGEGIPRLGIATPRRYGGAVRRNRFRRLVREAFRDVAGQLGSFDYMVSPKRSLAEPTLAGLREDLLRASRRSRGPERS
jgi:ribonuclease P protein component